MGEVHDLEQQVEEKQLILNVDEFEDGQDENLSSCDENEGPAIEEIPEEGQYLNDLNIFSSRQDPDLDYIKQGQTLESAIFGAQAQDVADKADGNGPEVKSKQLSATAVNFLKRLEQARENKDGQEMSNLVFDAYCEDLASELDLDWYEQKAARLIESAKL